uniref:Uncharacterized protein n=1 Tax=viral metagenome TaxID=1070528 RepID=A0A6C0KW25_9ZZZZ
MDNEPFFNILKTKFSLYANSLESKNQTHVAKLSSIPSPNSVSITQNIETEPITLIHPTNEEPLAAIEQNVEPEVESYLEPNVIPKVDSKLEQIEPPKVDFKIEQIGVVVTTYGRNNIFAIQNIRCLRRYLPQAKIFLYLNEVIDKTDILEACHQLCVEAIIIDDQIEHGGLTGTWNKGIEKCISNQCDIIILSNDDVFINETISHIIYETRSSMKNNRMDYFGPVTNNPGPKNEQQQYYVKNVKRMISGRGLNGFFMVFPVYVLNEVKFNETHYFDPKYPFGGNEDEWYERFVKKDGNAIIVPSTFVYHYKLQLWRKSEPSKTNVCLYTINTGNYDAVISHPTEHDFLYFTDNLENVYRCIELNMIPFFIEKSDNPHLQQRIIKTSPHLFLPPHYDISVYIDANVIPNMVALETMINMVRNNPIDVIHVMHPDRIMIKDEANVVIQQQLEYRHNVQKIIDMHQRDKFKDDVGLSETALLVRKYKNIIAFNEEWTKCINICIRDQISFNYLLWKYNISAVAVDNINKKIYTKNKHPKRKIYN